MFLFQWPKIRQGEYISSLKFLKKVSPTNVDCFKADLFLYLQKMLWLLTFLSFFSVGSVEHEKQTLFQVNRYPNEFKLHFHTSAFIPVIALIVFDHMIIRPHSDHKFPFYTFWVPNPKCTNGLKSALVLGDQRNHLYNVFANGQV